MSKQITANELADIVSGLLVGKESDENLGGYETYAGFMTDIAEVVCKWCGGEVTGEASLELDPEQEGAPGAWMVGIRDNDSLPDDGGVWGSYDPDGEL